MTVNQVNCCRLLFELLNNSVDSKDVSDKTIVCALDTVFKYCLISNKKKDNVPLTQEEKDFLNPLFYSNEMLLIRLTYKINGLTNNRKNEVDSFLKLFSNYNESEEFKINIYRNLPFRYADIHLENIIFSKMFDISYEDEDYLKLVLNLLSDKNNLNNYYRFVIFWSNEDLGFDCFKRNGKNLNQFKVYSSVRSYTKEELLMYLRKFPEQISEDYKHIIGQSSEMLVYVEEKKNLINHGRGDLAEKVTWVARIVGDGFGYDILSFDPETGKEKLIEVKGTLYKMHSNEFNLSKDESEFGTNISFDDKSEYWVYRVYIDQNLNYSIKKFKCIQGIWYDEYNNQYYIRPYFEDYYLHASIKNYKVKKK